MMKKEYMKPELEAIDLKLTTTLLAGSGEAVFGDDEGDPVHKETDPDYNEFD